MSEPQITYAAVKPGGRICGPTGEYEFVKKSLMMGAASTFGHDVPWEKIERWGYSIKQVRIEIVE